MSVKQARHSLMNGGECILGKLESAELQATANEIRVDGKQRSEFRSCSTNTNAVFRISSQRRPPRRAVDHNIDIQPDSKPRLSQPETAELQKQLEQLLQRGCIQPCRSPYGAPVFFVKMADSSLRLACDWRPLNSITVKNQTRLPNFDDLFDSVRGARPSVGVLSSQGA